MNNIVHIREIQSLPTRSIKSVKNFMQGKSYLIEIYREESKALAKLLPAKNIETLRITNDNQRNTKINDLVELDRTVEEQTENFGQALNTLRSAIESWKSRYLLIAPQTGNVFFSTTL